MRALLGKASTPAACPHILFGINAVHTSLALIPGGSRTGDGPQASPREGQSLSPVPSVAFRPSVVHGQTPCRCAFSSSFARRQVISASSAFLPCTRVGGMKTTRAGRRAGDRGCRYRPAVPGSGRPSGTESHKVVVSAVGRCVQL
eukprot:366349-Chlamydomonas_euryale.AAC.4